MVVGGGGKQKRALISIDQLEDSLEGVRIAVPVLMRTNIKPISNLIRRRIKTAITLTFSEYSWLQSYIIVSSLGNRAIGRPRT